MDTAPFSQQQRSFAHQGLGNNGGPPPPSDRQLDRSSGHYVERVRPTDLLQFMKDAGTGPKHTGCFHCGKRAPSAHRKKWRECWNECPFSEDDPQHQHTGRPCPKLMLVANADWCRAHVHEELAADRAAVRNPEQVARNQERRIAAKERVPASSRPGYPGCGESSRPGSNDAAYYGMARSSRRDYLRERSPLRNSGNRLTNYRDRATSSLKAQGRSSSQREIPSVRTEDKASRWAALPAADAEAQQMQSSQLPPLEQQQVQPIPATAAATPISAAQFEAMLARNNRDRDMLASFDVQISTLEETVMGMLQILRRMPLPMQNPAPTVQPSPAQTASQAAQFAQPYQETAPVQSGLPLPVPGGAESTPGDDSPSTLRGSLSPERPGSASGDLAPQVPDYRTG